MVPSSVWIHSEDVRQLLVTPRTKRVDFSRLPYYIIFYVARKLNSLEEILVLLAQEALPRMEDVRWLAFIFWLSRRFRHP